MTELADKIERLDKAATQGPWETDSTDNGEGGSERFNYYSVGAGPSDKWGTVFDTLNSDVACIHEEWDGDEHGVYHHAWDEQGRVNCELIVTLRNAVPEILAALRAEPPADVVEAAELLWTQLPTGRKWTSLPTHEKALICHILTACITSARHDGINKVLAFLRDNEPDEELAGCPALWSDFVQIAEARFCDMTENTNG